jgi:predicted  nucleic acid-binding Zn-ribbon protein
MEVGEERLAPLMELVERLRGELTELHGRWEALGEELEAKRRRLRLAEATVDLMKRRGQEEAGAEGGEEQASQAAAPASMDAL